MKASCWALLIISSTLQPLCAEETQLQPWTLQETYNGSYPDTYNKLRHEVPILMRQTMINLAVRCGLDFNEGWHMPIEIRFEDHAPGGVENILAYVQMGTDGKGNFAQNLSVNLAAYERESFNFDKVFAHELVHAMLNDSVGVESMSLPVWFHEGLAVYGADQGEQMMGVYVSNYSNAKTSDFINGLDGPHGGLDYLEDYLAIKYIHDRHGVNSLRNLIQELTRRKGDLKGAIEYSCSEDWETFIENAREFAEEEVTRVSRSQRLEPYRGEQLTKPY